MKFISIIMFSGILLINSVICVHAEESVQYELTPRRIKNICISEVKQGIYEVVVILNESDKKTLKKLTASNIGNKIEITCSGHILLTVRIKAEIDSGVIGFGEMDSKTARNLIENLIIN